MRRLDTLERTDWFRVLSDLQTVNWDNTTVAKHLEVPKSTLYGWKAGSEPTHYDGDRLLNLWRNITGRVDIPRHALPMKVGIPRR